MSKLLRVLIVDDDPALLRALPETLEIRMGAIEIDTADCADLALARIAETDYDAIVSDIKMPGIDGLVLLRRIRELRPATPTLLITGHGEHELAVQALRGGAYDLIQKPIDRDYFVAALTRAIQVRQMARIVAGQQADLERHAAELETTVQERTRELREANRMKDEFLATLSHELRTPLNSILGWAQLLRKGVLDEEARNRAINTIERSTKSLNQIIADLLEVSRIVTGKFKLEARPVRVNQVIEAAIDAVRPAMDAKGIRLQVTLDPAVGLVSGDPSRLQQVVWNLLSNAIKFTPAGGWVGVSLIQNESSACITVSDSGEGITESFLPYVFDRFRQADSTFTRKHGGLGIGLAIVRHLVEMHGGAVRADSAGEGQGATFTVTIPLMRQGLKFAPRSVAAVKPMSGALRGGELYGVRVLLVDDEPDARELLTAILEQHGARVVAVSSAVDALECLTRWPEASLPDVLVSDIGMPGEDGFDLIRKVRSLDPERGGDIAAIALTAYARPEDRARVLEAGYQIHVPKPVEASYLTRIVGEMADKKFVSPRTTSANP
jgi:signal transduction histidine kinase